jgi:hypothetical protein
VITLTVQKAFGICSSVIARDVRLIGSFARETARDALTKAIELSAAGIEEIEIVDAWGISHSIAQFERVIPPERRKGTP